VYYAIDELSNESKIPKLYELLNHSEYIVREAAAYPLARIEGGKSLPHLLDALVRGEEDGHDNDSLASVVSDLLELNKKESADILTGIYKTEKGKLRAYAAWGFGFIVPEISSDFLIKSFIDEDNSEVRAALAGALGSFKDEEVRISIIYTLVHIGDKNVIEKIKPW
jgi:HEAT repeat protein